MSITPKLRPKLGEKEVRAMLAERGVKPSEVAVLAVGGYYEDTFGEKDRNDRDFYDDALFVVWPGGFRAFNGNVDPSKFAPGIATLEDGVWLYKPGPHPLVGTPRRPSYPAFRQAADVVVRRDGQAKRQKGLFGINIHRGGETRTGSLGCQTVPPSQWEEFRNLLYTKLDQFRQETFKYVKVSQR